LCRYRGSSGEDDPTGSEDADVTLQESCSAAAAMLQGPLGTLGTMTYIDKFLSAVASGDGIPDAVRRR
jgi:hypothetical protein